MNRTIRHIGVWTSLLLAGVMVSCVKTDFDDPDVVRLYAGVRHQTSKAASDSGTSGVMNEDYNQTFNVNLVRIDENSLETPSYPLFKNVSTVLEAEVGLPDGDYRRDVSFTTAQYYRNNSDHIRYASWYPTSGVYSSNASESKVSFDVDGVTDIMYGSVTQGSKVESFSDIQFNHALCQFNVYVYRMSDENESSLEYDWGAITQLIIKDVQKKCEITLPHSGTAGTTYTISYPSASASDLQDLDLREIDNLYWNPDPNEIPEGFGSARRIATYLAPPPAKGYLNYKIHTSTMTSADTYQQVSIARNFQAGCAYKVILRFSSHGFLNAEVSVGDWIYGSLPDDKKIVQDVAADMYYDLSAYNTSNCYIVPSGNYGYSFKGNVRGNNSASVINPGYIDILWCDNENIWTRAKQEAGTPYSEGGNYLQLASNHLSENRVMFKVGDVKNDNKNLLRKGNLVIAAYDNETDKNVLWTWHIWLNDSVSNVGFNSGFMAMNMNLGATSESGEGLYYQWGRKDPFALGRFNVDTHTASVEDAILNPTTFYTAASGTSWYNGQDSAMNGFWGWSSDSKDIEKSMYDPCPVGYHVADYRFWGSERIGLYEKTYQAGNNALVEIANLPIQFNLSQGYLDASGQKNTGNPLFIWSSSLNRTGESPYSFLYGSSKNSPVAVQEHRNYGGAVRCLSRSANVVKDLSAAQTSNCYIISKDGYYKFKTNVGGMGSSVIITTLGNDWDLSGVNWGTGEHISDSFNPAKVDFLWYQPALDSTIPSSIESDDLCMSIVNNVPDDEGYVTFEISDFKKGNIILAAYDESDAIIWTWHFWLTDTPSDVTSGVYTLMDRNLGATKVGSSSVASASDALPTLGFYYQAGRKDPFPGPSSSDISTTSKTASSLSSSEWFQYNVSTGQWTKKDEISAVNGPQSVLSATRNPMSFIKSSAHWMEGFDSNKRITSALWGYAVEDDQWGTMPGKSIYDPCPVGYKVTNHLVFWNYPTNNTSSYNLTASGSYGYSFTIWNTNWYPKTGQRMNSTGYVSDSGSSGYYWNSVPYGSAFRMLQFGGDLRGVYGSNPDTSDPCACGHAVRCMKE